MTAAAGERAYGLLQDDRQGMCLGILIHGAHLITRSGAKPSRTACPRGRAWPWPPQRGRSKTDPHLKHFSLFFPGHSRKSCRYVGLSSQDPCGRARCNLLTQAPLCSSRCCLGVCPGAPCEGFHRGSPCQGCEPSAFLGDLINKGKTDERREKQLFGNEL